MLVEHKIQTGLFEKRKIVQERDEKKDRKNKLPIYEDNKK